MMLHENELPQYLSADSIAERFEIHVQTLRRWVKQGRFPKPTPLTAGTVRWRSNDIEAWENERRSQEGRA